MINMKLFMIILSILWPVHGFLLGNGNSTFQGKQVYLTAAEYYQDKPLLATHRELNLLATQIQNKLDVFEQKLLRQTATSQGKPSNTELDQKYIALEMKVAEMKNSSDNWQQKYIDFTQKYTNLAQKVSILEKRNVVLEQSLATKEQEFTQLHQNMTQIHRENGNLRNLTAGLQQKIGELEQLKNINQMQTLHNIEQKTQSLETKVNSLENNEQARSQDFLALYNKVNTLEIGERSLMSSVKNNTELISDQNKATLLKLDNVQMQQKKTIEELENRTMTELATNQMIQNESFHQVQKYVDEQLQPVILTACNNSGSGSLVEHNTPLKFHDIITAVGIPDLATFRLTVKFRCHSPGYYYVTTTIESYEYQVYILFMLNSVAIHQQLVTGDAQGSWTPGMAGVTLKLKTGDKVWIKLLRGRIHIQLPCLTIFKIK